jgi:hypothetical protein
MFASLPETIHPVTPLFAAAFMIHLFKRYRRKEHPA